MWLPGVGHSATSASTITSDLQYLKLTEAHTRHIVIGLEAVQARAAVFERVFRDTGEPLTGRWPSELIWMQTHPKYEPWGVLIERNGVCVAAALLTRRWRGFWQIGKPAGGGDPLHFAAVDDDSAQRLAESILGAVRSFGWPWRLEISDLPRADPVAAYLRSCWPHSQSCPTPPVPHLLFAAGEPLSAYLSHNTRSAVAKARNRIRREGIQLVEEWTRDIERIRDLMPKLLNVYCRRYHQLRRRSIADDPVYRNFLTAFVLEHANQGLVELLTLYLNRELAAFALCVLDNKEYWVLVSKASPDWLRYSPGTIANAEVVRHAFESPGVRGVNWGAGLLRHKLSGMVTLDFRQTLLAWSSPIVPLLIHPLYGCLSASVHGLRHFFQRPGVVTGSIEIRPSAEPEL
jgi:hypothetical protein